MKNQLLNLILACAIVTPVVCNAALPSTRNNTYTLPSGTSKLPDEPTACDTVGGASLWVNYTPQTPGTYFLDTVGSTFPNIIGVYIYPTGIQSMADLIYVTCDAGSGPNGTSKVQWTVGPGTNYALMIDGINGAHGTIMLHCGQDNSPTLSHINDITANEDDSITINFTASDRETTSDKLVVTATTDNQTLLPDNAITISRNNTNFTATLTPGLHQYGTSVVTVAVNDGTNTVQTSFNANILRVEHAPTVTPATYTRLPNTSISISLAALLRNATDIDGDTISIYSVNATSAYGMTVTKGVNFITYYPTINFNSTDQIIYTVSDGTGYLATGYATIAVGANGVTVVY